MWEKTTTTFDENGNKITTIESGESWYDYIPHLPYLAGLGLIMAGLWVCEYFSSVPPNDDRGG